MANGKTLVVVESPAKAKTIEKYLGGDYAVRASYGHIRDLGKGYGGLGVDVEHAFTPDYVVPEDSKRHVGELKKVLKAGSGDLILATDYDREGEAIAYHVATLLGGDPTTAKRVTFTEITRDAILEAFAHPREIDRKLFDAQEAREIGAAIGIDWESSPFDIEQFRIGLGVEHGDVRRAQTRGDEVPALHVRVRGVGAQAGTAGVPAEVVQLVAGPRQGRPAHDLRIGRRPGIHVDHGQAIRTRAPRIELRHVRVLFRRGLHGQAR